MKNMCKGGKGENLHGYCYSLKKMPIQQNVYGGGGDTCC